MISKKSPSARATNTQATVLRDKSIAPLESNSVDSQDTVLRLDFSIHSISSIRSQLWAMSALMRRALSAKNLPHATLFELSGLAHTGLELSDRLLETLFGERWLCERSKREHVKR